jgi:hypothetical protein
MPKAKRNESAKVGITSRNVSCDVRRRLRVMVTRRIAVSARKMVADSVRKKMACFLRLRDFSGVDFGRTSANAKVATQGC